MITDGDILEIEPQFDDMEEFASKCKHNFDIMKREFGYNKWGRQSINIEYNPLDTQINKNGEVINLSRETDKVNISCESWKKYPGNEFLVFVNGVKLLYGTEYTVLEGKLSIVTENFTILKGDIIEISLLTTNVSAMLNSDLDLNSTVARVSSIMPLLETLQGIQSLGKVKEVTTSTGNEVNVEGISVLFFNSPSETNITNITKGVSGSLLKIYTRTDKVNLLSNGNIDISNYTKDNRLKLTVGSTYNLIFDGNIWRGVV